MLNITQFRELIIKPALIDIMMYSEDAEELLVFTCATESNGGHYIKQVKGPALGIYQMEPQTYNDIWQNYLKPNARLMSLLFANFNINRIPPEETMIYDLRFATIMARFFYARFKENLPKSNDVEGIWEYYKKYFNTIKGKAFKEESIRKYNSFISS